MGAVVVEYVRAVLLPPLLSVPDVPIDSGAEGDDDGGHDQNLERQEDQVGYELEPENIMF